MGANRTEIKAASREMVQGRSSGTFLTFTQPLEHKNGHVFLLLDVDSSCKAAPNVIALLRESVERLGRTLGDKSHLQHRFEQVLQAVNEELAELVDNGSCPASSLHMAIGVLRDQEFILSATGHLKALFLRKTAKQRFRVFDLSQNLRTEAGRTDDEKLFSVVLDGDLQADDVLLIASRDLDTVLNVEEIHPLLSTLPPASALETIEQYLPSKARLSIVLFQVRSEKEVLTGFGKHTTGKSSMNALLETERSTTNMLELEKPHMQQTFTQLVRLVKSGNAIERKETLRRIGAKLWEWTKILSSQLFHIATSIAVSVVSLVSALVTRGSKRDRALSNMKSTWGRTINSTKAHFNRAGWGSRILLIGGLTFVILFTVSTVFFQVRSGFQADEAAFVAVLEEVQQKRDGASASVIYEDEAAARQQLQDALALLAGIETKKDARLEQIAELQAAIDQELNAIRHILQPQLTTIAVVNQVVTAGENNRVFFRDGSMSVLSGTELQPVSVEGEGIGPVRLAAEHEGNFVSLDENNMFAVLNTTTNTWERVGINAVEGEFASTQHMVHYGERLYMLTPDQVYRHQRVENGEYGPGTAWLTDTIDLSNVRSIAIDGTVWLADQGTVRRLEQGREIGANMSSIDPPLGAVRDVWTNADTNLLFILDPDQNRVVAYDKEAQKIVAQYVDPQLNSGFDLSIDLANRTAIVYAPTTVFTFPLSSVLQ